jgi:hypothetical protein
MKIKFLLSVLLATLLVPGLAMATSLFELTGMADCDGWSASAKVHFGSIDREAVLDYTVTLTNLDTGAMETQTGSEAVGFYEWEFRTYEYSGSFADLCGNYKVQVHFVLSGIDLMDEADFMAEFLCECDEPDGCFRTPGYWKTHPEDPAWPADGFAIGGVAYGNSDLIAIMERPVKGDATVILAHHLIAAKLNVLAGEDVPEFNDAIAAGDDLLAMYPLGSRPSGDAKSEILGVKDTLVGYNEIGCDDDDDGAYSVDPMDKADFVDETTTSWGSLKSQYR